MVGTYTSWKDLPRGFPTLGRPQELPARILEVSPDGTPAPVSAHEVFRPGRVGPKDIERDYIESHLIQNPLRGVKLYPPAGTKTDPAIVPTHGPSGGDLTPYDARTGVYFPADGETGISSNGVEISHFYRDGLKVIQGDAADGSSGYVPALIGIAYADSGTTGTGAEEVLATVTVPALALQDPGRFLEIEAVLQCAGDADAKTVRLRWGGLTGTVLVTNDVTTNPNNKTVIIRASVIQEGSVAQRCSGTMVIGAVEQTCVSVAGAQDETTAIDVVVTGQALLGAGGINDIVCKSLRVRLN